MRSGCCGGAPATCIPVQRCIAVPSPRHRKGRQPTASFPADESANNAPRGRVDVDQVTSTELPTLIPAPHVKTAVLSDSGIVARDSAGCN